MEGVGEDGRDVPITNLQPPSDQSKPSSHAHGKVKKKSKPSRQQVAVACLPCQKRKCRCDGKRPICSTCVTRNKVCEYNIEEGMSRVAHLKEKNKTLEESSKDLQAVIDLLRKGTDSDAASVLARLRVGHSISSIVQETQTNKGPQALAQQQPSESSTPSKTKFEVDITTEVPTHLKYNKIFNRQDWARLAPPRGVASILNTSKVSGSSHDPQASRSPSSWQHPPIRNPPTQAILVARPSSPLPIDRHHEKGDHPIKLRNFGNMDFSSGILANNYPQKIQGQQFSNLFIPQWAKMIVPIMLPEGHAMKAMNDSMMQILEQGRSLLQSGVSLHDIAGSHPQLSAILNDEDFERAPMLSQWASRMVFSIKESNRFFVCYASMYLFWWIMRWMIAPSPETYFAIPEVLRPSPAQLFMPHLLPIEFFAWPSLRDYLVRVPEKFDEWEWMLDMSTNIACECPLATEEILIASPVDGELELSPGALACVSDVDKWSVKPSFRQYFMDADRYMRIRWDD